MGLISKVLRFASGPPIPKPLSDCHFGFLRTPQWTAKGDPSPELRRAWNEAKTSLARHGASIVEIDLPPEFGGCIDASNARVVQAEGSITFLAEHSMAPESLNATVRGWMQREAEANRATYLSAIDEFATLRPAMDRLLSDFDAVITPSVPGQAPMGLGSTGEARYNIMWTALHQPCVNVPGFASDEGIPVSLSLVAPRWVCALWDSQADEQISGLVVALSCLCCRPGLGRSREGSSTTYTRGRLLEPRTRYLRKLRCPPHPLLFSAHQPSVGCVGCSGGCLGRYKYSSYSRCPEDDPSQPHFPRR
jgi:hypothetical protein